MSRPRQLNDEEIIEYAKKMHHDHYHYVKVFKTPTTNNPNTKSISYMCPVCDHFNTQTVSAHLNGTGCAECSAQVRRKLHNQLVSNIADRQH